jgi:hypothetical protein
MSFFAALLLSLCLTGVEHSTAYSSGMANNNDQKESYDDRLTRQMQYFPQHFGCSASPSFYFIHFHDGGAHWSSYSWGWNLSYMNLSDGDRTRCGKPVLGGTAVCKKCYKEKEVDIKKVCSEFNHELRENDKETIAQIIELGKETKIITYK